MAKKKAAGIALLAAAILSSYFLFTHVPLSWNEAQGAASAPAALSNAENIPGINHPEQGKVWVCPMHPEIMQDHPGACPICGMELVEAKEHAGHDHGIHLDTASVQKLGVRTASAKMIPLSRDLRTYGGVTADGAQTFSIHSKFDGWIQKSHIHSVGQRVEQGQVIYEIYSPDLIMQEKEYLRFTERRNQILQSITGDALIFENQYVMNLLMELANERNKFIYENVSPESLQKLEDSKMPLSVVKIVAEQSGVVTQINARAGTYAMPANALFTLANVSRVWVDVALYPDQAGQVKSGDAATIKTADGQKIEAHIEFVSPVAENNKASARIALDNKLNLRPGSFVDVIIHSQARDALALPRSAVMHSGDGDRVMLARGEGHFLPVVVETGIESGDWIEITDGLAEGAEVAVNGQFLLDAAASLNAAAQRMQESHMHQ